MARNSLNHKKHLGLGLSIAKEFLETKNPVIFQQPVVMIPADKYNQMIEDFEDIKDALAAEEEYIAEGGRNFKEYDRTRK